MCVIVHKPKDVEFVEDDVKACYTTNPAGFGVMFYDPETDRIIAKKALIKDVDIIQEIFKELKDVDSVYHFRIRTHGATNDLMSHPFEVFNKDKGHPMDMYLMHNGTITNARPSDGESDTAEFVENIVAKALDGRPEEVESEWFKRMVEDFIGGSRLVIMYGQGKVIKFNEKQGDQYKGCWVSNKAFTYASTRGASNHSRHNNHLDMCGEAWWERESCDTTRHTRGHHNNVHNLTAASVKLRGVEIKKGDRVHVYAENNVNFYAKGLVECAVGNTIWVDYTNEHGVVCHASFDAGTGKTSFNTQRKLQIFPMGLAGEQLPLSFEEASKKDKEQQQLPVPVTVQEESFRVKYQDTAVYHLDFDSKEFRWGGGYIDGATTPYGGKDTDYLPKGKCKETTLYEIYCMEPQERLDWFMQHREVAFGIWQDLIEFVILEDDSIPFEDEVEAGKAGGKA